MVINVGPEKILCDSLNSVEPNARFPLSAFGGKIESYRQAVSLDALDERERNAVVLRFFEGKSFQEVGAAVGASENAAKKEVGHTLTNKFPTTFRNSFPPKG